MMDASIKEHAHKSKGLMVINAYFSFSEDQNINTKAKPDKQKGLGPICRSLSSNGLFDIWALLSRL